MTGSPFDFVQAVASGRHLVITGADDHVCRPEPASSDLAWLCDLDDWTPTGESDPASFVRWVCPALRLSGPAAVPLLEVQGVSPQSDLGRLVAGLDRLGRREPLRTPKLGPHERYVDTDPAGHLDDRLRRRIEHSPEALHGDRVLRPAELTSIRHTREGLVVESASWWGSAPALDHQIGLAIDIALRLAARQEDRRAPTPAGWGVSAGRSGRRTICRRNCLQ